jgi:hypothetical protein
VPQEASVISDPGRYLIGWHQQTSGSKQMHVRMDALSLTSRQLFPLLLVCQHRRDTLDITTEFIQSLCVDVDAVAINILFETTQPLQVFKGIFACFARFGRKHVLVPQNIGVYSRDACSSYWASLCWHPTTAFVVHIRYVTRGFLSALFDDKEDFVTAVYSARETVQSSSQLMGILSDHGWAGDECFLKQHFIFPQTEPSDLDLVDNDYDERDYENDLS